MRPIIHIGPPKSATTSLQNGVIPFLGRPFQIRPEWTRNLSRHSTFEGEPLAADVIVSDEMLGEYAAFAPETIAERLAAIAEDGIIIHVARDPVDLFHSYYRQALVNLVSRQARTFRKIGHIDAPLPINDFFDACRKTYQQSRTGFFAVANINQITLAFARFFDVEILDFAALKTDPAGFVASFADICGCKVDVALPHDNRTDADLMREVLEANQDIPAFVRATTAQLYSNARLSPDREDTLRNWSKRR